MIYQVGLSWLLNALGVGKFVDRLLHVPDDALPTAAGLAGITNEQWRRVESVQKVIVKEGIALRLPGANVR